MTLNAASPPEEVLTLAGCTVIATVAAGTGTVGVVGVVVVPPVAEPVEPVPDGGTTVPEPLVLGVSVPVLPPPPQAANMAEVTAAKRN